MLIADVECRRFERAAHTSTKIENGSILKREKSGSANLGLCKSHPDRPGAEGGPADDKHQDIPLSSRIRCRTNTSNPGEDVDVCTTRHERATIGMQLLWLDGVRAP